MEIAFQSHFFFAKHLVDKATREAPTASVNSLKIAAEQIEVSAKKMVWVSSQVSALTPVIYEKLGIAREANEQHQEALESYNLAAAFPGGTTAHYRAGYLLSKMGESAWRSLRPSDALGKFMEAKKRIGQARQLPNGVTEGQRLETVAHIDRWITFLKEMKVK